MFIFRALSEDQDLFENKILKQINIKMCQKNEFQDELNIIEQQFIIITKEMKVKIQQIAYDVGHKVSLLYILCISVLKITIFIFILLLGD